VGQGEKEDHVSRFIDDIQKKFHAGDSDSSRKKCEEQNVEHIQRMNRLISGKDFESLQQMFDPDVHYYWPGPPEMPFVADIKGAEQVTARIKENFSKLDQDQQKPEVISVSAQGNLVFVLFQETGTTADSREEYSVEWVQLFEFSYETEESGAITGRRVSRISFFGDTTPFTAAYTAQKES